MIASTTEELAGQSGQLLDTIGFFRVENNVSGTRNSRARKTTHAAPRTAAQKAKPEPAAASKAKKDGKNGNGAQWSGGMNIDMGYGPDNIDDDFERF